MSIWVPPRPVIAPPPLPVKAGPIGPGSGVLNTEFPLLSILGQHDPASRMRKWLEIAKHAGWPRAAEDAIATAILNQPWLLEDGKGQEIDDEYPDERARAAYSLIESPQAHLTIGRRYTRSELWRLTLRHAGICGTAFWYFDRANVFGIPDAILYIQPWRMTPNEDAAGNLLSWQLDKSPKTEGIKVELEQVAQFVLHPPDIGHYGISMMEIALMKAQNDVAFDQHVAQVLSAGGRLSGILSPKDGDSLNDGQYQQLVADARTVVEQPDAAKRLQIMRGPVDFTQTTMTIADLQLADLMRLYRDDTLSLWGVPPGYLVPNPAGLSSGEARKYDKQVLWENAAQARAVMMEEVIQGLLDHWSDLGVDLDFDIADPNFGTDDVRFDLLGKSLSTPLRNRERRDLVGLEPFGTDVLNPVTGMPIDDEVWLPATQTLVFTAPEENPGQLMVEAVAETPLVAAEQPALSNAVGETNGAVPAPPGPQAGPLAGPAKAALHGRKMLRALTAMRTSADEEVTPQVKSDVAQVLIEQRRELVQRARALLPHLLEKPKDRQAYAALWDEPRWNRRMREAMQPGLVRMAEVVDAGIRSHLGFAAKAGPVTAVTNALTSAGTRITALNARTRDAVLEIVRRIVAAGIEAGSSPAEVGDRLEDALNAASLENGQLLWDEYRAEMIARTELMAAYNNAALGAYQDTGVEMVEAVDGHGDPECEARDGEQFTLAAAAAIEDHPNGTLDWIPIVTFEPLVAKAELPRQVVTRIEYDEFGRLAAVIEE